jgi:hypothetical protein
MATELKKEKPRKRTKQEIKNDELIETASRISALWMDFRKTIRRAFANQPTGMNDEQQFLELKSHLARLQRIMAQRLPEGFRYGAKNMSELMAQAISMSSLREMPPPDKKAIYGRWHQVHVSLQHLLGILDLLGEGCVVKFETTKARSGNIKEDIGLTGGSKKKGDTKKKVLVLLLLAAAGAAVYYVKYMK